MSAPLSEEELRELRTYPCAACVGQEPCIFCVQRQRMLATIDQLRTDVEWLRRQNKNHDRDARRVHTLLEGFRDNVSCTEECESQELPLDERCGVCLFHADIDAELSREGDHG